MARTSKFYTDGVEWIAQNDEPECRVVGNIMEQLMVAMLADLHGKTTTEVAQDVFDYRVTLGYFPA